MAPNDEFYAAGDISSSKRGSGARANKGKVAFSLVPFHLLAGATRVLMAGTLKYASWNWAKGMKWSITVDCIFRHLFKWWYLGEDIDAESGEHHLDHILCNVLFLKHYTVTYTEGDDRPPQDLTRFGDWMEDMMASFVEEEYLERNPEIKAVVEEHRKQAGAQHED